MPKKLLLADDSVTIQKVVELTFSAAGYEVTSVGNGDEALAALKADPPDLVIADVHMPGASGIEVARQVKSRLPELPVLLLVGSFEPFDEAEATASGADGHLMKPFDAEELLRLVEELTSSGTPAAEAEGVSAAEPASSTEGSPDEESPPTQTEKRPTEAADGNEVELSPRQIEAIARRVAELVDEKILRDVAWEVIPDLAEVVIKERLRELEAQVETADS